jgi:hypothetical protein
MSSPARDAWLSLTPEPERDLPAAIATLRAGTAPGAEAIEAERRRAERRGGPPPGGAACAAPRRRAERLVLRGNRRSWLAWLREAVELADARGPDGAEVAAARELLLDVIDNHEALELGLPGGRAAYQANGTDAELFERIRARDEKGHT